MDGFLQIEAFLHGGRLRKLKRSLSGRLRNFMYQDSQGPSSKFIEERKLISSGAACRTESSRDVAFVSHHLMLGRL